MICKDFNITNCPQCSHGRQDLCWMIVYRKTFLGIREKDIKDIYLECLTFKNIEGERYSYWFEAVIRNYYPQYQEVIDKIRILL